MNFVNKLTLIVSGLVVVVAMVGLAYYFGRQQTTSPANMPISVTGEPTVGAETNDLTLVASATATISPKADQATPTASPSGTKFKIPNIRVIPSVTPTTKPVLQANPNINKQLQLIPSPTLATFKIPNVRVKTP